MSHAPPTTPGTTNEAAARSRDVEHVRVLAILYYVKAGLSLFGIIVGVVYMIMGSMFAQTSPADATPQAQRVIENMGLIFSIMGGCVILYALASGMLELFCARSLQTHRHRTFCLVVAGLACLAVPIGTVLGVFTFIVLMRPSAVRLFAENDVV